jgi:hypothetical protein
MMNGCMPDCVQSDDPIINVVMMYDKKTPPKLENIVLDVDKKLFIYHCLSIVPKRMKGYNSKWSWDFESAGNIDPNFNFNSLITRFIIKIPVPFKALKPPFFIGSIHTIGYGTIPTI